MKALTLTQPWATLVMLGVKRVETRSWSTNYRGPLAIHAAKRMTVGDLQFAHTLRRRGVLTESAVEAMSTGRMRGVVIATARLAYVGPTWPAFAVVSDLERELGDFSRGRFGWSLTAVDPLPEPIPARGALGLWECDLLDRTAG